MTLSERLGRLTRETLQACSKEELIELVLALAPLIERVERAIRPAVPWRKRSFGTHSERGSRFAERMLTTFMTLKQQRRPVVDYVREACQAFLQGQRAPSLLPISKQNSEPDPLNGYALPCSILPRN